MRSPLPAELRTQLVEALARLLVADLERRQALTGSDAPADRQAGDHA